MLTKVTGVAVAVKAGKNCFSRVNFIYELHMCYTGSEV